MLSTKRISQLLFGMGLTVCIGCGTTVRFAATNPPTKRMLPRPVHTVDVYATSKPQRPYQEVGVIQARQSSAYSLHKMPDIIAKMRKKAAKIGCDGVLLAGANNTVVGGGNEKSSWTSSLEGFWGSCIMYTTSPAHSWAN